MTDSPRRQLVEVAGGVKTMFDPGRLAELYREHRSLRVVAAATPCSYATAHRVLVAMGVELRPRGGSFDARPISGKNQLLLACIAAGAAPDQIAKQMRGTDSGVALALRQLLTDLHARTPAHALALAYRHLPAHNLPYTSLPVPLTDPELDMLRSLAAGEPDDALDGHLGTTSGLYDKLGVTDSAGTVWAALRAGLLPIYYHRDDIPATAEATAAGVVGSLGAAGIPVRSVGSP
ncbi:hypothetical protein BDK92_2744 [Micromonospora pisi]|uniref:Helix-turn-helix domain-containing protein n=1 Tax=Micromonospora pisi TaxID=589240 RepID=A0A495JH98_9ACTN|nr:helix-turn-helix domain-containing protein [Micromonospora pisi]RKR88420.1 hypothetical protein BDK92_2744 [Micromonospora pisi]